MASVTKAKTGLPLLMGRAPVVHRTRLNNSTKYGLFKRTRPVGGGGAYSDSPYPFVQIPHDPEPIRMWSFYTKLVTVSLVLSCTFWWAQFGFFPRDDFVWWARYESLRRRRERRERQEMDILGIDEDDVDPKLVEEMDRLYIKGRNCA